MSSMGRMRRCGEGLETVVGGSGICWIEVGEVVSRGEELNATATPYMIAASLSVSSVRLIAFRLLYCVMALSFFILAKNSKCIIIIPLIGVNITKPFL